MYVDVAKAKLYDKIRDQGENFSFNTLGHITNQRLKSHKLSQLLNPQINFPQIFTNKQLAYLAISSNLELTGQGAAVSLAKKPKGR